MKIRLTFSHYIQTIMVCLLLLFSASVSALSCPGPKDFVSVDGLWGWSWKLNPNVVDFYSPRLTWTFSSPSGDRHNFLADHPLTTGLYFIKSTSNGETKANLYCKYELADGEIMDFFSKPKFLSKDEITKIKNTWKPNKYTYYRSCYSSDCDHSYHGISGYECSSTDSTADRCNVEFQAG